jgi:hypothetical protein
MSVLFGCIIQLILAGGLIKHCFEQGNKCFNRAIKKKEMLFQMQQVIMQYTSCLYRSQFFTKPIKMDYKKTVHQSYSITAVRCDT